MYFSEELTNDYDLYNIKVSLIVLTDYFYDIMDYNKEVMFVL